MRRALLLLWGTALALVSGAAVERRLLRDIPNDPVSATSTQRCNNTAQGLYYIADSQGRVCTRDDVDFKLGCCKQGDLHTCDKCSAQDKCCAEYEHCVSCCLAPQHDAAAHAKRALKSPRMPAMGVWGSSWSYCTGVCRTHSRSTSHENAYISPRHHCFSALGKPLLSNPLPAGALDGVSVVMGDAGEACATVCGKQRKQCSSAHLQLLNSCDRLRELVGCEAGCDPGMLAGASWPSYIQDSAPKPMRPAMCFTAPATNASAISCDGKDQHARRLCACKA